jgi:membrane-bound lytic murein transglycosylase D
MLSRSVAVPIAAPMVVGLAATLLWILLAGNPHEEMQQARSSDGLCVPNMTGTQGQITRFQFKCTEAALAEQGKGFNLTDEFKVTDGMFARRVHFWRQVFTLWSMNERVIHSEIYPEIVLEFGRVHADHGKPVGHRDVAKLVRHMEQRIAHYQGILRAMDKAKSAVWQGEQLRIAQLSAHIDDPRKFRKIADSLRLQQGQREHMISGLTTSQRYLPHIKRAFQEEGVPQELAYIAFIESSFNLKAVSRVGASGVYQIMPLTGRQFMRIDQSIDERSDPIKAGRVAAKIFKENYGLLKHWPLAVTAYNHGPYGLRKTVRRYGSHDLETLINVHTSKTFRYASKNFYVEFLAIIDIMNKRQFYYPEVPELTGLVYDDHRLLKPKRISQVLKEFNMTSADLMAMNPDLSPNLIKSNGTLPKHHTVKVAPQDQIASGELTGL